MLKMKPVLRTFFVNVHAANGVFCHDFLPPYIFYPALLPLENRSLIATINECLPLSYAWNKHRYPRLVVSICITELFDDFVLSAFRSAHKDVYFILIERSRKALLITETELKLIAAAAITGLSRMPNTG